MKIYKITEHTVIEILEQSHIYLKKAKALKSPSGSWDCYCKVYSDDKLIGKKCSQLGHNIETAYSEAHSAVKVDIHCSPGMSRSMSAPSR